MMGLYIDLNPVAAGMAAVPEESPHTSIKERVDHVRKQGREADLREASRSSVAGSRAAKKLEESLWLIPIEDRRRLDSKREGMLEGFTLGSYLMLVEYTGRRFRKGKASISKEIADVFDRLQVSSEEWMKRMNRMVGGKFIGSFAASSRERLREVAATMGVQRLANFGAKAINSQ